MGLEEHVRNDSFHAFSLFPYHVGFAEAPFYNSWIHEFSIGWISILVRGAICRFALWIC